MGDFQREKPCSEFQNGPKKTSLLTVVSIGLIVTGCGNAATPVSPPPPPPPPITAACGTLNATGVTKPTGWDDYIDFSQSLDIVSNVSGALLGDVKFIQSNTILLNTSAEDARPDLTMHRDALILFRPQIHNVTGLKLSVTNRTGEVFQADMAHPYDVPLTDQDTADGRATIMFSKCSWSAVIPWNFITPNLSLSIEDVDGNTASLAAGDIAVKAASALTSQNIAIGMLVSPDENPYPQLWTSIPEGRPEKLAMDYFQSVPIAKFTVGAYEPAYFPHITMPNGNVYTSQSTDTGGGVYTGDMRQNIAKELVATGINLAGIGISSSAGGDETQTRPYRQTTVFTSQGVYTNPDNGQAITVTHGLSGGGGQLTLLNTTGNEFVHEYGHDHGLGHYPGGVLSIHSVAGGWGFHLGAKKFLGNLRWRVAAQTVEIPSGENREPFQNLYRFNTDAMAGGSENGNLSEMTAHTANSAKIIQDNLAAQSGRISADSATGYVKWDAAQQDMVEFDPDLPAPDVIGVPVTTLLGFYDPQLLNPSQIFPALYGNYGHVYHAQTIKDHDPDLSASSCFLRTVKEGGGTEDYALSPVRFRMEVSNKFHINLRRDQNYQSARLYCDAPNTGTQTMLHELILLPPNGQPSPVIMVGH